jgi:AcrR family transcriptional regulator
MAAPTGRREANKQATSAGLRSAAKQLFASQGYERTTVRDIAQLANVTERTFYRYFDGKEDLVADEFRSWLGMLKNAILARPAVEPALTAVQRALQSVAKQAGLSAAPGPLWLVSAGPRGARPLRSTGRPLVRLEDTIAAALLARQQPGEPAGADTADRDYEFEAHVIARICVAALRSAIIELRGRLASETTPEAAAAVGAGAATAAPGAATDPGSAGAVRAENAVRAASDLEDLLARAFAIISAASEKPPSQPGP